MGRPSKEELKRRAELAAEEARKKAEYDAFFESKKAELEPHLNYIDSVLDNIEGLNMFSNVWNRYRNSSFKDGNYVFVHGFDDYGIYLDSGFFGRTKRETWNRIEVHFDSLKNDFDIKVYNTLMMGEALSDKVLQDYIDEANHIPIAIKNIRAACDKVLAYAKENNIKLR